MRKKSKSDKQERYLVGLFAKVIFQREPDFYEIATYYKDFQGVQPVWEIKLKDICDNYPEGKGNIVLGEVGKLKDGAYVVIHWNVITEDILPNT